MTSSIIIYSDFRLFERVFIGLIYFLVRFGVPGCVVAELVIDMSVKISIDIRYYLSWLIVFH